MLHAFTRNHSDHSTEAGFQFEFFCDCCGNGFKSTFVPSSTYGQKQRSERFGRVASTLGGLIGGKAGDLGWALERGSNALGDRFSGQSPEWLKEHERAFDEAQEEIRPKFVKCPSCNKWVCPDCWNEDEGLCIDCAPREAGYVAQARSRAMRRNIDESAEAATVWQGKIETRTTVCPKCGKPAGSGKFCNNCGAPLGTQRCPNCGAEVALGLKFCGECGSPMQKSGRCPSCGFENEPGMKFCGECGTKL
ncbi:MAG: zinc ribbon domain-containing protein [Oscillospiraceae bacterium]|nr:zinc ribbon domain-containing protein [Oscillospiraceae bacterium]